MIIQPHLVYSITEVSEILKINPRTIQRVGKRHKVEKVDNRYIFKGSFLLIVFKDTIKNLSQGVEKVSQDVERLSQEIEQKALEIQDIKTTAKEDVAHYKNLFEYQRKQSDRILEMHEKLIVTIGEQTQSSIQRNHIEAKDKNYL